MGSQWNSLKKENKKLEFIEPSDPPPQKKAYQLAYVCFHFVSVLSKSNVFVKLIAHSLFNLNKLRV